MRGRLRSDRGRALVAGAQAVHDPAAAEVVCRQLDANAVARVHPDPVAPHLPRRVTERLVAVVERDAEHAVAQRLDDLAGELYLLFLVCDETLLLKGTSEEWNPTAPHRAWMV